MGIENKMQELKGKAKEKMGEKSDNPEMAQEGRNEQNAGKAKERVDEVGNKVGDTIDSATDKLNPNRDRN